jgi:hypothetical protein
VPPTPSIRHKASLDLLSADNLRSESAVRYAVSTISDPEKMKLFRDDLVRSIRDDPNFRKGERDALLMADGSIRHALVDPRVPHDQFNVWANFIRENAILPIDQEARVTPTRPERE